MPESAPYRSATGSQPGSGRTRPDTREITQTIITSEPPGAPNVAPDIPVAIDPGPVPGVVLEPDDVGPVDAGPVDAGRPDVDSPDAEAGRDQNRLSPALVARLQTVHAYPCVSLLMTTRPASRMTPADAERLERLRLNAVTRLGAENRLEDAEETVLALDRLVQQAVCGRTDSAVAIYAGGGVAQTVTLPVEVADRAVVDPTFATRDLVRALHRTPRHVVLVISGRRAALLDGANGRLAPVAGTQFPMNLQSPDGEVHVGDRFLSILRGVDLGLGAYLRLHPAPLVIVGPQSIVSTFRSVSRNTKRLAGTVYGRFEDARPDELVRRTRPVLNRYLNSREHAALELLERRTGEQRLASGIAAAWLAARRERPEMLVVEEGYRFPARLSLDGDHVTPADDVEAPDVIDDLVDELIELVLDRGGWIALARDGSLTRHAKVALTLRRLD